MLYAVWLAFSNSRETANQLYRLHQNSYFKTAMLNDKYFAEIYMRRAFER